MGVLDDIGILNNKQISKSAFSGFVIDVKKRLKTGAGIFKSPTIGKPADPIENFDLARIEDQFLFPEFHRIWKERFTKTVQQLNLPSAHQAVPKIPIAPLIDPTALARKLGVKEPKKAKFPDILYEIMGQPPPAGIQAPPATIKDVMTNNPVKTAEFFQQYLSGLEPSPKIIAKIIEIVGKPPGNIVPQLPDPRTLKYGYTEQYNFEKAIYSAQRKAHAALMARAADPTFIPSLITQMMSGQNDLLLTEVYEIVSKFQPTPMSTSVFEIAAQEILMQHQVKLQCVALLAQNIGSGQIVQALAATPEDQGGLGLIDMSKSQKDQTSGDEKTQQSAGSSGGSASVQSTSTISGDPAVGGGSSAGGENNSPFAPSGQPVADEPPPGGGGTGGPSGPNYGDGYGMGSPPTDEYPPAGAAPGGPAQQPSGFGFGGPEPDVPPGGSQGQGSLASGPQGGGGPSGQQGSPFGFEAPADEVPPPGAQGGGGNSQGNVSPWDTPPDNYPSEQGSGQAAPPGWGGAPPDEGSPPYEQPPLPNDEPEKGEILGPENPKDPATDPEVPIDDPPAIGSKDMHPEYAPENAGNSDDSDNDDGGVGKSSKNKNNGVGSSKVRQRIRDLLEGGPTVPLDENAKAKGFKYGGACGPKPDYASMPEKKIFGKFVGYSYGRCEDREWDTVIPGTYMTGLPIGNGYANATQIAGNVANRNTDPNATQSVVTSCTQLAGYVLGNVIYGPRDNYVDKKGFKGGVSKLYWSITAEEHELAHRSGCAPHNSAGNAVGAEHPLAAGLGIDALWWAAANGCWVNAYPFPYGKYGVVGDPAKAPRPKYGDIYLFYEPPPRKSFRHVGIILDWHPEEGWWSRADAGQGNMNQAAKDAGWDGVVAAQKAQQGMSISKDILTIGTNGAFYGGNNRDGIGAPQDKRIIGGWCDMEAFAKKMKEKYRDQLEAMGMPPWLK